MRWMDFAEPVETFLAFAIVGPVLTFFIARPPYPEAPCTLYGVFYPCEADGQTRDSEVMHQQPASRFKWGEDPMALWVARLHSAVVPMPVNRITKAYAGKVTRSEWHHFFSMTLPFQRASEIRLEAVGGVTVVGLILGVLVVMRFLVGN